MEEAADIASVDGNGSFRAPVIFLSLAERIKFDDDRCQVT
jgi:hypothetical protein